MRNVLLTVAGLLLGALIIVFIMWLSMDDPRRGKHGFKRSFLAKELPLLKSARLEDSIKRIVGAGQNSVFFSTMKKGEIAWTDYKLSSLSRKSLLTDTTLLGKLRVSNSVIVDSPTVYIMQGSTKMIVITDLKGARPAIHQVGNIYTNVVPMSTNTLLLRKFKDGLRDQLLYRYDLASNTSTAERRTTTPVDDGGLMTGGMLHYDETTNHAVYVHYYCNKLVLLDSNLNIIKEGNTIDTFKTITTFSTRAPEKKEGYITNAGPARYVNAESCAANGLLYVQSSIKADNESDREFLHNRTIDVYDMSDLSYKGSYRINTGDATKLRNMVVKGDKLFALFNSHVSVYSFKSGLVAEK